MTARTHRDQKVEREKGVAERISIGIYLKASTVVAKGFENGTNTGFHKV